MKRRIMQLLIVSSFLVPSPQAIAAGVQRLATTARSACGAVRAAQRFAMPRAAFKLPTVAANSSRALSVLQQHGQTHQQYRGAQYAAVAAGFTLAGWSQHQTAYAEEDLGRQLREAAERADVSAVKRLLARVNVNTSDWHRWTALHKATWRDKPAYATVAVLIDANADLNLRNNFGDTPLHNAIHKGHLGVVRLLICAGARTDIKNDKGKTARDVMHKKYPDKVALLNTAASPAKLLRALSAGAPVTRMQALLQEGLNPNDFACSGGQRLRCGPLLTHAVRSGNEDVALCLIEAGADVNPPLRSTLPLAAAAENDNIRLMELLMAAGATVDHKVLAAACTKNVETVRFLLSDRTVPELEQTGQPPVLFEAVQRGDVVMTQLLLQKGASPTKPWQNKYPLEVAVSKGDPALVQLLLKQPQARVDYGACAAAIAADRIDLLRLLLDKSGRGVSKPLLRKTLFKALVRTNACELVELLLQKGADPNERWRGKGVLEVAASKKDTRLLQLLLGQPRVQVTHDACKAAISAGQPEPLRMLLQHGRLVTIESGEQPLLHYAMLQKEVTGLVELLIEQGALVKTQFYGQTALHLACKHGKKAYVQLLLDAGADIEARNDEQRTALHVAAASCRPELVQLLLDAGALTKTLDKDGKRAVELCKHCNKANAGHIRSALAAHWMATRDTFQQPSVPAEAALRQTTSVMQTDTANATPVASEQVESSPSPCQECSGLTQVTQWLGLGGGGQCCNGQQ